MIAPQATAPLAVWDTSDPQPPWREICAWAQEHFPHRANDVYRAEIYLIDTPFAVLFRYAENASGHRFLDRATGEAAVLDPVTVTLDELPPGHLLASA